MLAVSGFQRLQRFAAPVAATCSGHFFGSTYGYCSFTSHKKMKTVKLIARWWWLILILLFSATLLYFIWTSQQQVNALDRQLTRPSIYQPSH